jgi:hypothetical protein
LSFPPRVVKLAIKSSPVVIYGAAKAKFFSRDKSVMALALNFIQKIKA